MNVGKLNKCRSELERLRTTPSPAAKFEALAKKLGRKIKKGGKHPMWISEEFPNLRPLSIPHHGSRDLPTGTRGSIANQLELDILRWEEKLE